MRLRIARVAGLLAAAWVVGLSAADGTVGVIDAVKQGNQAAVKKLVAQRADVNAAEADGMTALHWAVRAADVPTAQLLIRAGAKVNAANRYGVTPIILAAQNGDPVLVEALLKAGADANSALPEGETALMNAARAGSAGAIKALVAHGARVREKEGWQGQTALMWAASQNSAAAVTTLIELGADKDEKSKPLSFPDFKFETAGMVVLGVLEHAARVGLPGEGAAPLLGHAARLRLDLFPRRARELQDRLADDLAGLDELRVAVRMADLRGLDRAALPGARDQAHGLQDVEDLATVGPRVDPHRPADRRRDPRDRLEAREPGTRRGRADPAEGGPAAGPHALPVDRDRQEVAVQPDDVARESRVRDQDVRTHPEDRERQAVGRRRREHARERRLGSDPAEEARRAADPPGRQGREGRVLLEGALRRRERQTHREATARTAAA